MKVLIATNNPGKLREIREILAATTIEPVSLREAGAAGDPVEDATTFEGNALIKARAFALQTGLATIADDSGLCVDALDGAPGVLSARFSGPDATDSKNNALLLKKLADVPEDARSAHFACAMVCAKPDGTYIAAHGTCEGRILFENLGENGFGYDPLFYVPALGQTFAEIPAEIKHAISHRGRALRKLVEMLPEFLDAE